MRVLHVVPTYLPATRYGGPIYSVHGLARALVTEGCDVHVYTTNVDGPGVSDVPLGTPMLRDGVNVTYFSTGFGRRVYRAPAMGLALAEVTANFDIVHLHSVFLWPTSAAAAAARAARVPYLLAPRGMLVADLLRRKSALAKWAWILALERRNLAQAAAVHVTSELEARDLRNLGLKTRRIVVVPNGIDDAAVADPNECGAANRHGQPNILFLGRITWKKGLDRLIAAMARVPQATLTIAGNDEEGLQTTLEQQAQEQGIAARVVFVGPVSGSAKSLLLRTASVFVLPSHSENFGIAVLEAMAAGCPVIVSAEVGLADTVRKAGAGLVSPTDPEGLARSITALLADPELRLRMGAAGRAEATGRFGWQAIAAQMMEVYRQCVASHCEARAGAISRPRS